MNDLKANELKKKHLGTDVIQNAEYKTYILQKLEVVFETGKVTKCDQAGITKIFEKLSVISKHYNDIGILFKKLYREKMKEIDLIIQ